MPAIAWFTLHLPVRHVPYVTASGVRCFFVLRTRYLFFEASLGLWKIFRTIVVYVITVKLSILITLFTFFATLYVHLVFDIILLTKYEV